MSINRIKNGYQKKKTNIRFGKLIKEIYTVGCSGIIGVFITLGYQHFSSQQSNEAISNNNQQQEQELDLTVKENLQIQPFTLKDVDALTKKIFELESQNVKLESNNISLNEKINDIKSKYIEGKREDYHLIINGIERDIDYKWSIIMGENIHIYVMI